MDIKIKVEYQSLLDLASYYETLAIQHTTKTDRKWINLWYWARRDVEAFEQKFLLEFFT